MKKILFFSLTFLLFLSANAINLETETIYFKKDKSRLNRTEKSKLNIISDANQYYLIGHTDSDGNDEYNQLLSKKRVDKVYHYLISKGVNKSNISVEYFGEKNPLNNNETLKDKKNNRRVEIKFLKDPLMSFEVEDQIFDVNDNEITNIKGKDGTEIFIQANTFLEKDVKIVLKEYYKVLDILSANLSTTSHGEMIETGGMLHIEAYANGIKVEPMKPMAIFFENNTLNTDYEYFSGTRNSDLSVDWNVEKSPNADYFTSSFFNDNFGKPRSREALVAWLTTKDDKIMFDWFKYFNAKKMLEMKNSGCFKSDVDIKLDNYGNVIKAGFIDSVILSKRESRIGFGKNIVLKCNDFIENARRKIFDKGSGLDPNKYEITLKEINLSDDNKSLLEKINEATSLEEKNTLFASLEENKQVNGPTKFLTQTLGWINCDRFTKFDNTIEYVVKVPSDMNIRMIVNNYNSYFNSVRKSVGDYHFVNLPLGEEVTLICTKFEKGEIVYAIEETVVSKDVFSDFNFSIVTKEELKEKISML